MNANANTNTTDTFRIDDGKHFCVNCAAVALRGEFDRGDAMQINVFGSLFGFDQLAGMFCTSPIAVQM